MGVSITIVGTPPFAPGAVVGAYEARLFGGPPPVHQAPVVVAQATAVVSTVTGRLTFEGLRPLRRYYAGAQVGGAWSWVTFLTGAQNDEVERQRAEAREAALLAELGTVSVVANPGGSIKVWGESVGSALGIGVGTGLSVFRSPTEVPGLSGVLKVSGGQSFMLALLTGGRVAHWGGSTFGQAGDGSAVARVAPHVIALPAGEIAVDADARSFPLVLLASGRCVAWGGNSGQLGIGSNNARWVPSYVETAEGVRLEGVKAISAGHLSGWFLMADGLTLRRSGIADLQGVNLYAEPEPTVGVAGWPLGPTITKVCGSKQFCCCLLSDGTLRLKGRNNHGEMGTGGFDISSAPTKVWADPGLTGVKDITISEYTAYALMDDGTVRCWGRNHRGQVGNGHMDGEGQPSVTNEGGAITGSISGTTLSVSQNPTNVKVGAMIVGGTTLAGTEVTAKLTASTFTVSKSQTVASTALTAVGPWKVSWALVAGQTRYEVFWRTAPFDGAGKAIKYSKSSPELSAATAEYLVTGWGEPTLEAEVRAHADVPTPFDPGLTGVVQLVAAGGEESGGTVGDWFALARMADGTVKGWGGNGDAELGNGGRRSQPAPVAAVSGVSDAIGLGAVESHAAVIRAAAPTAPLSMTVTQVPGTSSLLVSWTPDANDRVTGWKVEWRRVENNPATNKAEPFKKTTESGNLPAATTSFTIPTHAENATVGLPLPALWANATNMMEVRVEARYVPASAPVTEMVHLEGHKWRVRWTDVNGPSAYNVTSKVTAAVPEPGYIVRYRLKPGESFVVFGHSLEEVPAGVGEAIIEGVPPTGVEAQVEGAWATLWQTRTVEAIPAEMPAEVPWIIVAPSTKVNTPFWKPKTNVALITEAESLSSKSIAPETWQITWPQVKNAKGQTEPGWFVRWRSSPQTDWALAKVSPEQVAIAGTQSYTIPESLAAKPEAQVYGSRLNAGDVVEAVAGSWGGALPVVSRTYQWFRQDHTEGESKLIAGATSATYQVQAVDAGYALRVLEVPTNAVGEANVVTKAGAQGRFMGAPSYAAVGG